LLAYSCPSAEPATAGARRDKFHDSQRRAQTHETTGKSDAPGVAPRSTASSYRTARDASVANRPHWGFFQNGATARSRTRFLGICPVRAAVRSHHGELSAAALRHSSRWICRRSASASMRFFIGPRPLAGSVERSVGREIERDPAERGGRPNIFRVCFDRKPPYVEGHGRRDGPTRDMSINSQIRKLR
jgi:hypothetical protein